MTDEARRPYQPIACATHDELLALATLRRESELTWTDASGAPVTRRSRIVDVYTRDGAEYLKLEDDTIIRLDDLRTVDGKQVGPA